MTMAFHLDEVADGALGAGGELGFLLGSAGVYGLDGMGWIRAKGEDAVRWLNGMVTNSIQELKPGDGNYSFALNAQGRIQGDLWAFAEGDGSLLLETARERVEGMMAMFDRFIIMDDVELEDVSARRFGVGVAGPRAAEALATVGLAVGSSMRTLVGGVEVIALAGGLAPRFEIWGDEVTVASLRNRLIAGAEALGGGFVSAEAVEWLRMLEGTPRYGVDIREKELPQETGQTRALHFAKGCYLGQEIVERIRSRGNVHRGFGAFRLHGPLPAAGAALDAEGKVVGELTSVAEIPLAAGAIKMALGYVRREVLERGAGLSYATADGAGSAAPMALRVRVEA